MSVKEQIETDSIALLAAGSFSQTFTPEQGPITEEKLEQITSLVVLVTARLNKRKRFDRRRIEWDFLLQIGAAKKVGFVDGLLNHAGLESMQLLAEEIADAFEKLSLTNIEVKNPICPEIDYMPDDGVMWDAGIVLMQVDVPLICWTTRP